LKSLVYLAPLILLSSTTELNFDFDKEEWAKEFENSPLLQPYLMHFVDLLDFYDKKKLLEVLIQSEITEICINTHEGLKFDILIHSS